MVGCAIIQILFFIWLSSLDHDRFMQFVSSPDTPSYIKIALELTQRGSLIASPRTLGYPLFLSLGYLLGGMSYGPYLVIAAQLTLNIVFTWGCWMLLQQIAPAAGTALRVVVTLFFFWAGMGMALNLLSDFLASSFFGIFLFGLLFWRSRVSLLLSGTSLALATLVRPTFTFVPLLLPFAAYLVGRITSKVPPSHVMTFIFASVAATGISVAYQYSFQGYAGPSPVLAKNIGRTLNSVSTNKKMGKEAYEAFNQTIADRAGKPYSAVSPSEEEKYAVELFMEQFSSRPKDFVVFFINTFLKYLFVPTESLLQRLTVLYMSEETYHRHVRPVLTAIFLPLWVLCLWPPAFSSSKVAYYVFALMFLFYIVGITIINPVQGERIRFPVLAFILPVALWNSDRLFACFSKRTQETA
jgi:hypothetical protein